MLLTNHVVSGALIGALARRPLPAFAVGVASPSERRPAVLAGMAGAALPDMDKPTKLWFGGSPFPAAVDRFHNRIQREAWHRGYIEILAAATLAPAALAALRPPRQVAGTAGRPGRPGRRG